MRHHRVLDFASHLRLLMSVRHYHTAAPADLIVMLQARDTAHCAVVFWR